MIFRRSFLSGAAAAALSMPTVLRAHTEEPFVLADEFQPREVRVREQHAPGPLSLLRQIAEEEKAEPIPAC